MSDLARDQGKHSRFALDNALESSYQPAMPHRVQYRAATYLLIEGLNSFSCTIVQMSLYFWASFRFGYSASTLLWMGALQGLVYVVCARYGGLLADRFGYDRLLRRVTILLSLLLLTAWRIPWHGMPFVIGALYMALIAPSWTALEAAVALAPSPLSPARRIGVYNIVWSLSGAVGFFVSGALYAWQPDSIVWVAGLIHGLAPLILYFAPRQSGQVDPATEAPAPHSHLPPATKKSFLHTALLANASGYFMAAGFSALAPHIGHKLGLSPEKTIWLVCTFLFARAGSFVLFARWENWHYRRSWMQAGIWTGPVMLLCMLFAPHPAAVMAACLLFGLALGLSYYAALYYSMDYSDNKGEHGGLHEAIIGLGLMSGPLVGALGTAVTDSPLGAEIAFGSLAFVIPALGLWLLSLRPRSPPPSP